MRLIDADAFIKYLEEKINGSRFYTEYHSPEEENVNYEFLRRLLDNFPGYVTDEKDECVEAIRNGDGSYGCSSCKGTVSLGDEYCPHCGEKLNWLHTFDTFDLEHEVVYCKVRYQIEDISIEHYPGLQPDELTITAKEIMLPFTDDDMPSPEEASNLRWNNSEKEDEQ